MSSKAILIFHKVFVQQTFILKVVRLFLYKEKISHLTVKAS